MSIRSGLDENYLASSTMFETGQIIVPVNLDIETEFLSWALGQRDQFCISEFFDAR